MSIATQIQNYNDGLLASYEAVSQKGGAVPEQKNLVNLPDAIDSIPSGGEEPTIATPDGFERPASWPKLELLLDEETDIPNIYLTYDKSVADSLGVPFFYSINRATAGTEDCYFSIGKEVNGEFVEYEKNSLKEILLLEVYFQKN